MKERERKKENERERESLINWVTAGGNPHFLKMTAYTMADLPVLIAAETGQVNDCVPTAELRDTDTWRERAREGVREGRREGEREAINYIHLKHHYIQISLLWLFCHSFKAAFLKRKKKCCFVHFQFECIVIYSVRKFVPPQFPGDKKCVFYFHLHVLGLSLTRSIVCIPLWQILVKLFKSRSFAVLA